MTQLVQNVPEKTSSHYQWESAADGFPVTLEAGIVERLRTEVLTAFRAVPRRGMETGGILLGRVDVTDPLSITVQETEPVPCEHRSGPAFHLSESDRAQLGKQLGRARDNGLAVVGYYRSCTGRDISLDAADLDLIREFWPERHHVFLLIKPVSIHECVAAFLFHRDGEPQTTPEHPPFAFRTGPPPPERNEISEPLVEERQTRDRQPTEVTVATKPEDIPAVPAYPDRSEPRRRMWHWALACVALFIAMLAIPEWWTSLTEPRWGQLGLNVSPSESGLEVSWDSSKPEVRNARRGVLTISEDDSTSEIELNRAALTHGTFRYRHSGNDVLVRLRVDGAGSGDLGETFRFVNSNGRPSFGAEKADGESVRSRPQVEEPPSTPQPAAEEVASAAPPAAAAAAQSDGQSDQQPPRRITTSATAIHEAQPFVSEGIRARLRDRIVVPVTVSISDSGQVISAAPQRDGDAVYRYLASRAAQAARSWRFKPARAADNSPLESSKTLHFVFTP